jgi:hypothetical protein
MPDTTDTTTPKLTARSVRALARRHWPRCEVRHNAGAPDKAEREASVQRRRELKARADALRAEQARGCLGLARAELTAAARFALDVDGDEPSWSQLRAAVEKSERQTAVNEELRDIEAECQKLNSRSWRQRWEVVGIEGVNGIASFSVVHASADTLEELVAKLEATHAV